MCDNQYDFAYPWNNSFYYHYLQQHAIMSHHFQKLNNITPYDTHFPGSYNHANVHGPADCSSYSSSSCSSCSSGNCSGTSTEYEVEEEEMYNEEGSDDEDSEEDESECEYEFNVDAILAMRAAKEELKKAESSESKDDSESKSDSIVLVDSDKDDFEFVDLSSTKVLDYKLSRGIGKVNKNEEEENQKKILEYLYGEDRSKTIAGIETAMALNFERLCDNHQPSLWPVLPLRL